MASRLIDKLLVNPRLPEEVALDHLPGKLSAHLATTTIIRADNVFDYLVLQWTLKLKKPDDPNAEIDFGQGDFPQVAPGLKTAFIEFHVPRFQDLGVFLIRTESEDDPIKWNITAAIFWNYQPYPYLGY